MFTGLVQQLGRIQSSAPVSGGMRLGVRPDRAFENLQTGESIAVNGVCLTAEPGSVPERLDFFLSNETLSKTNLGDGDRDAPVNLERSLRAGDRLGGHLVMGHVDGTGRLRRLEREGDAWTLEVETPEALLPFLAPKGSISVDGISLTVVRVLGRGFTSAIIPHTYEATNLHAKKPGAIINLEIDMIARYVVRYLSCVNESGIDRDLLRRAGFVE